MSSRSTELQAFHTFLTDQIVSGQTQQTPEACLQQWRAENPSPEEFEESVAAVREAIDDMNAGDAGVPARELIDEARRRHSLHGES